MQYDQTFYNQLCTDNTSRNVRIVAVDSGLTVVLRTVDLSGEVSYFGTDLYLDEQDREALAAALRPVKPQIFGRSDWFLAGAIAGLILGAVLTAIGAP